MPPLVALAIWFVALVALFYFDPARDKKESWALWVPLIWMFFIGSRDPSQWISGPVLTVYAADLQRGNTLDRAIFSSLLVLAFGILIARSFRWGSFLVRNLALMLFLIYCLTSSLWSDFPFITVKHWIRDLANYLIVLVVLTDPRPLEAVRTVFRRLGYLLIPLSMLLIKYFPVLGKQYGEWSGIAYSIGASTSKNMLGAACLVCELFFLWDTTTRWSQRRQRKTKQILFVNGLFILMGLWLLRVADSTTSTVCLGLVCLVLAASQMKLFRWRPLLFKALAPTGFLIYLVMTYVLDMRGTLANAVGKDASLTDRTKIWAFLLDMHTNPIFGVGYQTFWVGPRLMTFWFESGLGHLNEAHNGYLEVYLELGLVGSGLLIFFLVTSYVSACRTLKTNRPLAILGCATWMIMVFYNMSEASFEGGLLFMLLLVGTMSVPQRIRKRVTVEVATKEPIAAPKPLVLEPTVIRTTHWSRG